MSAARSKHEGLRWEFLPIEWAALAQRLAGQGGSRAGQAGDQGQREAGEAARRRADINPEAGAGTPAAVFLCKGNHGFNTISDGISKLVFTILSAVAEAERDRIRERIRDVKRLI